MLYQVQNAISVIEEVEVIFFFESQTSQWIIQGEIIRLV